MAQTPPQTPPLDSESEAARVSGRLTLFGHEPAAVQLRLLPRSRRWRLLGAVRTMAVALVLAPVAALVPPHVPWALGVLGVGGFLARRRLQERFTVVGVVGDCPHCSEPLRVGRGRLRRPHPLPCESCHREGSVEVADEALPAPS